MILDWAEHLRNGILAFVIASATLLIVLRLTRQSVIFRSRIKVPFIILYILFLVYVFLYSLGLSLPLSVELYYYAVLAFTVAFLLIRVATHLFFVSFLQRRKKYRIPKLLEDLTKGILYLLVALSIIQHTLKIQVTTLLATSAIITVVIGLALQETLGNLFAGLAIHLDPPYQVGDWIRTGDRTGKVEEITWRATKLRTTNNDFIVIPNGHIAKETLVNHSFPRTPHAARVSVAVSYSIPPNKVSDVVKKCLAEMPNVTMEPPPEVRLEEYQDFSILYTIKFWYKDFGLIEPTIASIKKALWYHFRRNGIEIPFPIRNVYLHDQTERFSLQERAIRELTDSLKQVYLFSSLEEEERRLIAKNLQQLYFARDEMIIREGEAGDSFFIIEEGEVEVFITSASGNRKTLTTLGPGDFFGEIALLTGEKRSASVQALTDVRVRELKKERFKEVLERKPEILDEISGVLSRRKDQLVGLMAEVTHSSGESPTATQEVKSRILSRIRNYFGL